MRRRWLARAGVAALAAAATLGSAACGGGGGEPADAWGGDRGDMSAVIDALGGPATFGEVATGGTFRIANTEFAHSDGFDPSGEYLGSNWMIYGTTLLRTLLATPSTGGDAGEELVPDLATEMPEVSADELTYTFALKDGVTFGPPVNREVTSQDLVYSIERLGTPSVAAQYAFYYEVIKGFTEFSEGRADAISGVTTPDDKTIIFKLTKPTGDFLHRMTMPATAPIPKEVARCHTRAGQYGRFVISTGPYMIEGADELDISSCASQRPISGFDPGTGLTLVRNPSYDPGTDNTEYRQSNPDRFEITVNADLDETFDQIERGELETSFDAPPGAVVRRYLQDPEIRERLRVNAGDRIWFAYMNLTTPPFDDVHVRKAMNLVMDLEAIQRAWGGPVRGATPTHLLPESLLSIPDYDPYQRPPFAGDVDAAKAEMAQSRYDTDHDGTCDAEPCKGVINLNRNAAPWSSISPIIEQSAVQIGITIETREASRTAVSNTSSTTARRIPFSSGNGWAKDYADPSTFMMLFDGRGLIPVGKTAFSLVGVKPTQARELVVEMPEGSVPDVGADIDRCVPLTGQERTDCWTALDMKITEEIAPWVPLIDATSIELVGPAVTQYAFDQFGVEPSLARVAVDPSRQN
jgi:peptide/nickel transport system substrate-binding protein